MTLSCASMSSSRKQRSSNQARVPQGAAPGDFISTSQEF
jgi:hypothetical protein